MAALRAAGADIDELIAAGREAASMLLSTAPTVPMPRGHVVRTPSGRMHDLEMEHLAEPKRVSADPSPAQTTAALAAGYTGIICVRSTVEATIPAMLLDPSIAMGAGDVATVMSLCVVGYALGKLVHAMFIDGKSPKAYFNALLVAAAAMCCLGGMANGATTLCVAAFGVHFFRAGRPRLSPISCSIHDGCKQREAPRKQDSSIHHAIVECSRTNCLLTPTHT